MRELGLGEQSGETPQTGLSGGDHEDTHAWDEPLSSTPGSAADGAGGGERGDRKGGGEGGETPRPESQGAAAAGESGPGAELLKSTRGRPKGSFPGKGAGRAQRRKNRIMPLLFFARDHSGKHFALADMIGLTDHTFSLHSLDNSGGPVIADL